MSVRIPRVALSHGTIVECVGIIQPSKADSTSKFALSSLTLNLNNDWNAFPPTMDRTDAPTLSFANVAKLKIRNPFTRSRMRATPRSDSEPQASRYGEFVAEIEGLTGELGEGTEKGRCADKGSSAQRCV